MSNFLLLQSNNVRTLVANESKMVERIRRSMECYEALGLNNHLLQKQPWLFGVLDSTQALSQKDSWRTRKVWSHGPMTYYVWFLCGFDNQIIAYTVHTQYYKCYTVAVGVVDSDRQQ